MESEPIVDVEKARTVAIPFIKYDVETQGFQVTEDAIKFLSQIEGKVGVIGVCGKYRTGKSYLMNKLFLETVEA